MPDKAVEGTAENSGGKTNQKDSQRAGVDVKKNQRGGRCCLQLRSVIIPIRGHASVKGWGKKKKKESRRYVTDGGTALIWNKYRIE